MRVWLIGIGLLTATSMCAEDASALGHRSLLSGNLFAGRAFYLSADFEKNPDLEPLFHAGLKGGLPLILAKKVVLRLGGAASLDRELNTAQIDVSVAATLDAKWIAFGFGGGRRQGFGMGQDSSGLETAFWGLEGGVRVSPWDVLSLCFEVRRLSLDASALAVWTAWAEFSPFATGTLFAKGALEGGLFCVSFGWEQRISFISFRLEFQPDPMFVSAALRIPFGPLSVGYGMRVNPSLGMFHQASLEMTRNAQRNPGSGAAK
ncbi:MAG: hypothetical protein JNM63_13900 [Spirochaetia bacterium]|nr:hypothetical protein [Spirochaetia bacterium]